MAKLNLAKKESSRQLDVRGGNWKVLVVDDDREVHVVTRLALRRLMLAGRGVDVLSAYSAKQALEMLVRESDIAIVLLDVVMETDDAGLRLVQSIRDDLKNTNVRIILRTGQPGQAPEEKIIVKYDINDYKAKTELTSQKLFTTTLTALRTYDHLQALDAHRWGLQQIIDASDSLFKEQSLQHFASGVLIQLGTFFGVGTNGILCVRQTAKPNTTGEDIQVFATSNPAWATQRQDWETVDLEPAVLTSIIDAFDRKTNVYGTEHTTFYFDGRQGPAMVAYLHCPPPENIAKGLLELFCSKITIGFSNVCLYEALGHANVRLEQKVLDRTNELAEANRQLTYLATIDALTNVPNRRYFHEALEREVARLVRYVKPFCVIMLDIDKFKAINDRYGHMTGDQVLRAAAKRFREVLREVDVVARIGGEEFAALLPETSLLDALIVAERLRARVASSPVEADGAVVSMTISVGVVEAWLGGTVDALLSLADSALYAAKNDGRNRVCSASLKEFKTTTAGD